MLLWLCEVIKSCCGSKTVQFSLFSMHLFIIFCLIMGLPNLKGWDSFTMESMSGA